MMRLTVPVIPAVAGSGFTPSGAVPSGPGPARLAPGARIAGAASPEAALLPGALSGRRRRKHQGAGVSVPAGGPGEQCGDGAAGEQGGEHGGAELIHAALGAAGLEPAGEGGDPLVSRDHLRGRQLPARDRGVPGRLVPQVHPRVLPGRPAPPLRGLGVDLEDLAAQGGAELPGGQVPGTRQQPVRDRAGVSVVEGGELVSEHHGSRPVDDPGGQGCEDGGEAV